MWTTLLSGLLVGALEPQIQLPQSQPYLLEGAVPGHGSPPARLGFPANPATDRFAPFTSAEGNAQAADATATGAADFDGDGNQDLWFLTGALPRPGESGSSYLTEPGPRPGALSVQMGRTSTLGRYRPWHVYPRQTWTHAASFRARTYNRGDRILLVDPARTTLAAAYYSYPFGGDPRAGTFVINASWAIGSNAYRIATADHDGDGNDDIALLQRPQPGWTRVTKLRMGDSMGWLQPETTVTLDMPFEAGDLRLLDHDADGSSDLLVSVPDVGIFLLRDDGNALQPVFWLPYWNELVGLFVGDADRDGRDDFGMVFADGILLVLSTQAQGFQPVALPTPQGTTPLHAGAVLGDFQGNLTSVVGFPADGRSFVIFPFLGGASYGPAEVMQPAELAGFGGSGSRRPQLISADIDGDGDEDVVIQLPDRAHWLTLRNGEERLAPDLVFLGHLGAVGETGYHKHQLVLQLPDRAAQLGLDQVEVAVFLEDITLTPSKFVYWGRLELPIDPTTHRVSTLIYSQTDPLGLRTMIQNGEVLRFADGITAGGNALLSIHLKQGPRRYESLLIHHNGGGGGGNKSAVGVQWRVQAAPPKADMDNDLLPWN